MVIVRAEEAHIPDLIRLLQQVGQVHHALRPDIFPAGTVKYDAPALQVLLRDPDRPILVALVDGAVVGYCFCVCKRFPATAASTARRELYIDDLCVDAGLRRRGIARALYGQATTLGKELGCQSLTLNVWCGNDAAQRFYAQLGLRPRNMMMEISLEETTC